MSSTPVTPADQTAAAMMCVCGVSAAQHQGKAHPFMWAQDYDPATWKRGARFAHEELDTAAAQYVTVEDRFRLTVLSSAAINELDVLVRIQRPDGQVIPIRQPYTIVGGGPLQTFDFDLTEGFLLDVTINNVSQTARTGQAFVTAQLIRGAGANAIPMKLLCAGYPSNGTLIGWPAAPCPAPTDGAGAPLSLNTANPGAGANISITVSTSRRWRFQSLSFVLTTSAVVANRVVHIQLTDAASNVLWDAAATTAQTASTAIRYSVGLQSYPATTDNSTSIAFPLGMSLLQGWIIRTVTTAIDVGDQFSGIWSNVMQWMEL